MNSIRNRSRKAESLVRTQPDLRAKFYSKVSTDEQDRNVYMLFFNTILNFLILCGYRLGGFWFLPGPGSPGTSRVLMLHS